MKRTTWRAYFRPIIWEILETNKGQTLPAVRAALRRAKPAEARTFSSVAKVWCSEVKKQMAARFPATETPSPEPKPQTPLKFGCFLCADLRKAGTWPAQKTCATCAHLFAPPKSKARAGQQGILF